MTKDEAMTNRDARTDSHPERSDSQSKEQVETSGFPLRDWKPGLADFVRCVAAAASLAMTELCGFVRNLPSLGTFIGKLQSK
jgi:hypothetical protein